MRWLPVRLPRRLLAVWLAWTAAGVFFITRESLMRLYRGELVPWVPVIVGWLASVYIWAALTPAILWAGHRWPIDGDRRARWRHAATHAGLSALLSVGATIIEAPVLVAVGASPLPGSSWQALVPVLLAYSFHGGVIQYWAVVAIQALLRSRQRIVAREREALELQVGRAELARQLTASQLSALKMQLQPHFLFNTLGAIMVLVQQGRQREAEAMLARLSDLLRLVVDEVHMQEVPLWRELEFLRLYLSIEAVRFEDRLRVRIATEPHLSDAMVPHMVLQPIAENAVRHGLGQSEDAVTIDIEARQIGGQLVLTVSDDGPGAAAGALERQGVGLTNTENRLTALYGGAGSLRVERRAPRGVRVTVALPFHGEEGECG
ncbi:MAG: histidine kinase [Vicinamibacteraceae bacterium]